MFAILKNIMSSRIGVCVELFDIAMRGKNDGIFFVTVSGNV